MTPKLYKATDVCEIAQVQPYVLRSWEKEFPGIGVQKGPDSPRFYRQSDLDQVLRIKQLVFGEGLTVSGARRRLEENPETTPVTPADVAEVLEVLGADARTKIAGVRDGLKAIQALLADKPGAFTLEPPPANGKAKKTLPAVPVRKATRGAADTGARAAVATRGDTKKASAPAKRRANA